MRVARHGGVSWGYVSHRRVGQGKAACGNEMSAQAELSEGLTLVDVMRSGLAWQGWVLLGMAACRLVL